MHVSSNLNRQANIEFGEEVASRLKLTKDGTMILWPQPDDDPSDPQNVRVLVCWFMPMRLTMVMVLVE